MLEGVPFLYQTIQGDIFHVADSITLIKSWSSEEPIVAFIDADTASHVPKDILIDHSNSLNIITQGLESTMDKAVRQIGDNVCN